ncbi:ARM repeat-containing protein, partial [Neoconidiobolus thromboides FSU 785]
MASLHKELANLSISASSPISESLKVLSSSKGAEELKKVANEIAATIQANGVGAFGADDLLEKLDQNTLSKSSDVREGTLYTYTAIINTVGKPAEPFIVSVLTNILECLSDKVTIVRQAADETTKALISILSPNSVKAILPTLFEALELNKKWQTKEGSLNLIASLPTIAHRQVQDNLKDILPVVSDAMWDSKPQVKTAAKACMTSVTGCVGNGDIEPFLPHLINCIADPTQVPETIYKL